MIKTLAYFVFLGLTVLVFFVGEFGIHVVKQMDLDRIEFETIFMPIGAISQIVFPFFIVILVVSKIKKGSFLLGMICIVIGVMSIGLNYDGYQMWEKLIEKNQDNPSFQKNTSLQILYYLLNIVKGILILSAGAYFVIYHIKKRKNIKQN